MLKKIGIAIIQFCHGLTVLCGLIAFAVVMSAIKSMILGGPPEIGSFAMAASLVVIPYCIAGSFDKAFRLDEYEKYENNRSNPTNPPR